MSEHGWGLIGTISGSRASFALTSRNGPNKITNQREFVPSDHPHFLDAIDNYLSGLNVKPEAAAFAVAGAVRQKQVRTTHAHWRIREQEIADRLGIPEVCLLNDCEAAARSLTHLTDDMISIPAGPTLVKRQFGARAVVLMSDGLGLAGLCEMESLSIPLDSEGGHSTFAPISETEYAISARIASEEGRCSNEMMFSRSGVARVYRVLGQIRGQSVSALKWNEVVSLAAAGTDRIAEEAVNVISGALGTFFGDIALIMGARDGLYFGGDVGQALAPMLGRSQFRARFDAKAPQATYMAEIPTVLIRHTNPALLGAALSIQS